MGLDHLAPGYRVEVMDANLRILEAEDRLATGEVPDDELYDVVLFVTGSELIAEETLYQRMRFRALESPNIKADGE